MKCEECNWEYPQYILSVFSSSRPNSNGKLVCGICALTFSNRLHGVVRTRFDGDQAERYRQQAINWRVANPGHAPTGAAK